MFRIAFIILYFRQGIYEFPFLVVHYCTFFLLSYFDKIVIWLAVASFI